MNNAIELRKEHRRLTVSEMKFPRVLLNTARTVWPWQITE